MTWLYGCERYALVFIVDMAYLRTDGLTAQLLVATRQ